MCVALLSKVTNVPEPGPDTETVAALVVRLVLRERLSPILMTSLATGLALVPLVVLGPRPGHEIDYPLAIVILGGLVTSTLLTLLVTPSLYLRSARPRQRPAPDRPAPDDGDVTVPLPAARIAV